MPGGCGARLAAVRLVIARCSVDYVGKLSAHLPSALRLLIVKADGSVLVHSDGGSYKPLNWMPPPCRLEESEGSWRVVGRSGEELRITIEEIVHDFSHDLGADPGLVKDGVEAHLQELLAEQVHLLGEGWRLVRREYPTAIGPVDLVCRGEAPVGVTVQAAGDGGTSEDTAAAGTLAPAGAPRRAAARPRHGPHLAVEVKRVAGVDAVEQLTRYLELLNRDPLLAPVHGVLAAQSIRPQARTLAEDRGIRCVVLDYDAMRGVPRDGMTLF
jgi:RecB family endonuclease NucS